MHFLQLIDPFNLCQIQPDLVVHFEHLAKTKMQTCSCGINSKSMCSLSKVYTPEI